APGGKRSPIRGEHHRRHLVGVADQRVAQTARPARHGDIPQQHCAVSAPGGKRSPIRGDTTVVVTVSVLPVNGSRRRRGRAWSWTFQSAISSSLPDPLWPVCPL